MTGLEKFWFLFSSLSTVNVCLLASSQFNLNTFCLGVRSCWMEMVKDENHISSNQRVWQGSTWKTLSVCVMSQPETRGKLSCTVLSREAQTACFSPLNSVIHSNLWPNELGYFGIWASVFKWIWRQFYSIVIWTEFNLSLPLICHWRRLVRRDWTAPLFTLSKLSHPVDWIGLRY